MDYWQEILVLCLLVVAVLCVLAVQQTKDLIRAIRFNDLEAELQHARLEAEQSIQHARVLVKKYNLSARTCCYQCGGDKKLYREDKFFCTYCGAKL